MPAPGAGSAPVTITCDRTHYAPGDTIAATITNGTASTIFIPDHGTCCTLLHLRRAVDGGWQDVGRCAMMSATRLIGVAPGTLPQMLVPGHGQIRPLLAWPAGTYRLALTYASAPERVSDQPHSITSATFTIG